MQVEGTFAKLLAPFPVEDFFRDHWERESLQLARGVPDYYHDLLPLSALDQYFQAGNLAPYFLRVVQSGVDCDLDRWTAVNQRKNTDPYRVVVTEKLFSLLCNGATIIINAAQTALPSLSGWCAALERELETRIQPNIYITPAGAQGFDYHFDSHDVFIMQISGKKLWRLYDYPVKLPAWTESLAASEYENTTPKQTVELRAGDLLYLPRGTVHSASTSDEASIHITVALSCSCGFNLVEELALIAQQDEAFRHALPHGLSSVEERANFVAEFRQRLQALVEKVEIETLLARRGADFQHNRWVDQQARLTDLIRLDHLSLDSAVSCRPGTDYRVEPAKDRLIIRFAQQELAVPRFMKDTVESLLSNQPYAVRELRGPVSDAGKLELVRMFVRAGLLRIEGV